MRAWFGLGSKIRRPALDIWIVRGAGGTINPMKRFQPRRAARFSGRRGAGTLEFVLALGVVLPLVAIAYPATRRMLQLVYEMTCTLISWPFL